MTPLFPAQRAAEEFERVLSGTADDAVAARYAELRDAVEQLRTLPEVTPRAEFVGDLRSRLMTAAETELVVVPQATLRAVPSLPEERTKRRNRRLGTIAASLVVVGGTAGMAAAASGALPGETLYPIKRGIEQVTTAAHFGDAAQGRALLGQAATRLDEVRALQAEGNADPDVISQTMDAFRTAADSGSEKLFSSYQSSGDQADITAVRDFTAAQMADVAAMSTAADTVTNDLLRRRRRHPGRHRRAGPRPVRRLRPDQAAGVAQRAERRRRGGHGGQPARQPGQPGQDRGRHDRGRPRGPHQGAPGQRRERGQQVPVAPGRHQPRRHPQLLLPRHPGQRREPDHQRDHPRRQAAADGHERGRGQGPRHRRHRHRSARSPAARPTRSPSRSTTPPRSSATPWATRSARRPTASLP